MVPRDYPRWLKLPLWVAAGAIILACLLGYVALGRFLSQQIMMTGVIALVATLLFLAIRAFTRESSNGRNSISLFLEEQIGLDAVAPPATRLADGKPVDRRSRAGRAAADDAAVGLLGR